MHRQDIFAFLVGLYFFDTRSEIELLGWLLLDKLDWFDGLNCFPQDTIIAVITDVRPPQISTLEPGTYASSRVMLISSR
jgi:hypothetical protein